ncbi:MAG: PAS domain-containing protein [Cyclobacteriaceae bacterium]
MDNSKPTDEQERLNQLVALIRENTSYDFTQYKPNSVLRRVQRRMTNIQIDQLDEYLSFAKDNPDEIEALVEDLFITVTTFFRNTEVFEFIRDKILPQIFSEEPPKKLKIWVAACATGEEAYTWAILVHEYLRKNEIDAIVQIFATDVHPKAIAKARSGLYSKEIGDQIPEGYLSGYFSTEDGYYRINKEVRDTVIFSEHDIVQDPPFSNMNIVSCRNLSIYLDGSLQQKIFSLLNYALVPGGILVIGKSESLGDTSRLFKTIHSEFKIYQQERYDLEKISWGVPKYQFKSLDFKIKKEKPTLSLSDVHQEIILDRFTPPSLLIDHRAEILHIQGRTGKYLEMTTGEASRNLINNTKEELKSVVSYAIRNAIKNRSEMVMPNVSVVDDTGKHFINVIVTPVEGYADQSNILSVVFQPVVFNGNQPPDAVSRMDAKEIEQELLETRRQLQDTIEALGVANEEEQSANEELQSINEELEASREELQSVNEELLTTNERLQGKIVELNRANSDIKNLLDSTNILTLFLDSNLHIRRFTPSVNRVMGLKATDIGRPIQSFKPKLEYDQLAEDLEEVLRSEKSIEREIKANDGTYYWLRMHLYRNVQNKTGGVVVTFTDNTEKKKQEQELENYRDNLEQMVREKTEALKGKEHQFLNIVNSVPGTVLRYQINARGEDSLSFISQQCEELWGVKQEDALRDVGLLWDVVVSEDVSKMRRTFQQSAEEMALWDRQWRIKTNYGKIKWLHGIGVPSKLENGAIIWDTLILDVTEKKLSELALEEKTAILERTESIANIGSWEWDVKQNKTYWSKEFYNIFGMDPETDAPSLEEHAELISPESFARLQVCVKNAVEKGESYEVEIIVLRNGEERYCYGRGFTRIDEQGEVTHLYGSFQDITDRKKIELALQESEQNYKDIAYNVPGLMFRYMLKSDGTDELLFLSNGVEEVYEISQEDAFGDVSLIWERIHPNDLEWFTKSVQKSATELSTWNVEFRIVMPDGRIKWLNGRGVPKKLANGSVVWNTMALDITGQKKHERELEALNNQLDLAIKTAEVGVWMHSIKDNRIEEINQQQLDIYGLERAEFIANPKVWQDYVHEEDWEETKATIQRVYEGEIIQNFHFRVRRSTGEIRYVAASARPLEENGEVVKLIGINLDITEFKKIETQLTEAKEKAEASTQTVRDKNRKLKKAQSKLESLTKQLDLAIETSKIGVWTYYTDTGQLDWNDQLYEIYGISKERFAQVTTTWRSFVHPEDQELVEQEMAKPIQGETVSNIQFRIIRPDGDIRYINAAASPMFEKGKVTGLISINLDITDFKKIEAELTQAKEKAIKSEKSVKRKNKELKKTNQELDRFVYSVSHDLRSPIASSIGLSELSLNSDSLEEVHEYDQLRIQTLQKLDRFIHDILNYSRNSRVEIKPEVIDFTEMVESIVAEYYAQIEEGKVQVHQDITVHTPFTSDRLRIDIILNNLISNAFKFVNEEVESFIKIKIVTDIDYALIEVSDNGIGIEEEKQDQIFDMFYRANSLREGSGIGLYILKECVEKLKGTVDLKSKLGEGTTFTIRIPPLKSL